MFLSFIVHLSPTPPKKRKKMCLDSNKMQEPAIVFIVEYYTNKYNRWVTEGSYQQGNLMMMMWCTLELQKLTLAGVGPLRVASDNYGRLREYN